MMINQIERDRLQKVVPNLLIGYTPARSVFDVHEGDMIIAVLDKIGAHTSVLFVEITCSAGWWYFHMSTDNGQVTYEPARHPGPLILRALERVIAELWL